MLRKICFFCILLLPIICFAATKEKKEVVRFNLNSKIEVNLPFSPEKFQIDTLLTVPELQFKGKISFRLISTTPFIWEIKSPACEIEISSLLSYLKKIGFLPTSFNLTTTGKIILNEILFRVEENHYVLKIKEGILPSFYGLNPITFDGVEIDSTKNKIDWKIEKVNLGTSIFSNLNGCYTQTKINISCKKMFFEVASLSRAIFAFNPQYKQDIFKKIAFYKDMQLSGEVLLTNVEVGFSRKEKKFLLDAYQAQLSVVDPLNLKLFGKTKTDITCISLMIPKCLLSLHAQGGEIKANQLDFGIKNLIYLPETTFTFYPLKQLKLNGKIEVKDIVVNLLKKEDKFSLNSSKAKLYIIPLTAIITSNLNIPPTKLLLTTKEIDILGQENNVSLKTNYVELNMDHFVYPFKDKTYIDLSGGMIFDDVKTSISKEKILATFNFQNKPININWNKRSFHIKEMKGNIAYSPEKIEVSDFVSNISMAPDGFLKAKMSLSYPFEFKPAYIEILAKNIEFLPVFVKEMTLKKLSHQELTGDYDIGIDGVLIKGKTRIDQKEKTLIVISPIVEIKEKAKKTTSRAKSEPKPFDFSWTQSIAKISPKWHLEFDQVIYEEYPPLESLKIDAIFSENNQLALTTRCCGIMANLGCNAIKNMLSCFCEAKAISVNLEHLLGCFIHEAPIYVTGKTNIQLTINAQGRTDEEFIDSAQIDSVLNIEAGRIMKLSNLHKSLGFILDIMQIVKLNPTKLEDTLPFDSVICTIKGTPKELNFSNIRFISPIMRFFAEGNYDVEKQIFSLQGKVEKGIFKKSFSIEKNLRD